MEEQVSYPKVSITSTIGSVVHLGISWLVCLFCCSFGYLYIEAVVCTLKSLRTSTSNRRDKTRRDEYETRWVQDKTRHDKTQDYKKHFLMLKMTICVTKMTKKRSNNDQILPKISKNGPKWVKIWKYMSQNWSKFGNIYPKMVHENCDKF